MPRELIEPHKGDKRYIRRAPSGQFTEKQVDVGRSLAADRRSKSKSVAKKGKVIAAIKSAGKLSRPVSHKAAPPAGGSRDADACSKHRFRGLSHPKFFV